MKLTPAMGADRARQLFALADGEDALAYRDRAILKFFLYSAVHIVKIREKVRIALALALPLSVPWKGNTSYIKGRDSLARKRRPQERKLRTREHVLADLSINYVERQIFLRGFAVNRMATDYGIDLAMLTFTDSGQIESGHVFFQVKGTDNLQILKDGKTISLRIEVADLKWWQREIMPVILVVYDANKDNAYWLHVQHYVDEKHIAADDLAADQDRVTVRIPMKNRLGQKAIEAFRQMRNHLAKE